MSGCALWQKLLIGTAIALSTACMSDRVQPVASLAPLPNLNTKDFIPQVRGRLQEAFDRAQSNPQDAAASGELGMLLHAHGENEAAALCYERATTLDGTVFRWPYYLGTVLAELGRHSEAVDSLREALDRNTNYLPARLLLADLLLTLGHPGESETSYRSMIAEDSQLATAYYGLGRALAAKGRSVDALSSYHRASELAPDAGAAHYALALAYREAGDRAKAREHFAIYEEGTHAPPAVKDPVLETVRKLRTDQYWHLEEGQRLQAGGDLEQAKAEYEKAASIDPHLVEAHVNLIAVYGSLGQPKEAEQHYHRAITISPNLEELHHNWGVVLVLQNRLSEARTAFRKALELNPNNADSRQNLGYVLQQMGDVDQALTHYRRTLESDPNHRLTHFHLGRYYVSGRRYKEAIEHLEKTLTPKDEKTPHFHYVLADAYVRSGQRQRAIRHARKAWQLAVEMGQLDAAALIEGNLKLLEATEAVP